MQIFFPDPGFRELFVSTCLQNQFAAKDTCDAAGNPVITVYTTVDEAGERSQF